MYVLKTKIQLTRNGATTRTCKVASWLRFFVSHFTCGGPLVSWLHKGGAAASKPGLKLYDFRNLIVSEYVFIQHPIRMPGHELITLSLGNYANYVSAHYWNLQVGIMRMMAALS